ncbi:hypothetical protein SO802_026532 [Lithocarpus litseifolius]|uniref:Aminotransferase-like plant mobile domain-containing protein n=1 Tax=Lithocarpus litseifolius TaxID=425828 RepID=A0AAW2C2H0_9ROSI
MVFFFLSTAVLEMSSMCFNALSSSSSMNFTNPPINKPSKHRKHGNTIMRNKRTHPLCSSFARAHLLSAWDVVAATVGERRCIYLRQEEWRILRKEGVDAVIKQLSEMGKMVSHQQFKNKWDHLKKSLKPSVDVELMEVEGPSLSRTRLAMNKGKGLESGVHLFRGIQKKPRKKRSIVNNTRGEQRERIKTVLGIKEVVRFESYLGLPTLLKRKELSPTRSEVETSLAGSALLMVMLLLVRVHFLVNLGSLAPPKFHTQGKSWTFKSSEDPESGRTASSRDKPARMGIAILSQEKDKSVKQTRFLALWLSKFLFSEFSGYGIKSTFFPLAIKLARGTRYPLAPMFLGHVYSQLDLLHGDEVEGFDLIVGSSSDVPIKREVVEEIGATTPIDPREVDPSAAEKEVSHPPISKIKVKTKVSEVVKDAEFVHAPIPSVIQDLEATQTPVLKDPKSVQTHSPAKTVIAEQTVRLVVTKESFGTITSSTRIGQASAQIALKADPISETETFEESFEESKGQEGEPPTMAEAMTQI